MFAKGLHKVAPHLDFRRGAVRIEGNLYLSVLYVFTNRMCIHRNSKRV